MAFGARHKQRRVVLKMEVHKIPAFDYNLDESDPDVVILRVQDGSFVAAFSATGVTTEDHHFYRCLRARPTTLG